MSSCLSCGARIGRLRVLARIGSSVCRPCYQYAVWNATWTQQDVAGPRLSGKPN